MAMLRRCECGLRNDEFHESAEDAGSSIVAEDASARVMTAGLAASFPIVYPLLAALQSCTDINASTTLGHDNGNRQCFS